MPIDLFLRSLAEDQQGRAIGVILSGTASDGTLGIQAIKAMGGMTFRARRSFRKIQCHAAQRRMPPAMWTSSCPPDMHRAANSGESPRMFMFLLLTMRRNHRGLADKRRRLRKIYAVLRNFSRVDFSYYKARARSNGASRAACF